MIEGREIDPTQAREKVRAGRATLVCAYDDESKCTKILLEGSLTMRQLRAMLDRASKEEEIILYCA